MRWRGEQQHVGERGARRVLQRRCWCERSRRRQWVHTAEGEPPGVEREQRGDVCAGGVADEHHLARVRAVQRQQVLQRTHARSSVQDQARHRQTIACSDVSAGPSEVPHAGCDKSDDERGTDVEEDHTEYVGHGEACRIPVQRVHEAACKGKIGRDDVVEGRGEGGTVASERGSHEGEARVGQMGGEVGEGVRGEGDIRA